MIIKRSKKSQNRPDDTSLKEHKRDPADIQKKEKDYFINDIRPGSFKEYVGQKDLKKILDIVIKAAKLRNEPIDHLLLYGPPGLGKTTISLILASEMGVDCKITSAPSLEKPKDIIGLLVKLKPGDVLFLDEIHRLNHLAEELLYLAMEDYRLDITIGKGQSTKISSISLPKFTLIGATTKIGNVSFPLRDRFGLVQRLKYYEYHELILIIKRSAIVLQTSITHEGAIEIAIRSRGTPRIANRLLRRIRDYIQVKRMNLITKDLAIEALDLYKIDSKGLNWTDHLILETMIFQFNGGPVGLEAIAASTGEDIKTIEQVYEPYLLQIGYVNRTPRGRVVTEAAYKYIETIKKG
ncbi:MAG: Holliday junction DNA helicase subunit RuvB [Candidatus Atelocyanobacterium thalassa isolate SIO64986]|uniref:Holliday junction branch migration complex subunit RuvB n=1 Tax=Candidatus Atelocyanobacterium thalassa isolate SIO64986 TaxID=1527444 RepID=A0A086CGP4_9CHRO|nr:MAG: Holliday junction DNA helicase subunit RuvB [Candidatus Atelocyanobacterium thalassa isolate SIO64986]